MRKFKKICKTYALQFFVENRMTIEASALLQKMKEKGIKPYDENFKL